MLVPNVYNKQGAKARVVLISEHCRARDWQSQGIRRSEKRTIAGMRNTRDFLQDQRRGPSAAKAETSAGRAAQGSNGRSTCEFALHRRKRPISRTCVTDV